MSTVSDNKQSKQVRILDAAFRLFSDKSVHATAIDDVVKLAGVAKGTFYLYFKDKYDLLDQIVVHKTKTVIEGAVKELKATTNEMSFIERIDWFTDYLLNYLSANKKFASLINHNLSACFRALTEVDGSGFSAAVNEFVQLCANASYTPDTAKKLLYIIINMIGSVGCDAVLDGKPYALEEIRPVLHISIRRILQG